MQLSSLLTNAVGVVQAQVQLSSLYTNAVRVVQAQVQLSSYLKERGTEGRRIQ